MSNSVEFPLNSPVIHGVKREPLDTNLSTDDFGKNNSSFPVKNRILSQYDYPNQLEESKVFVNSRLTQFSPDQITSSTSHAPPSSLNEVKPKLGNHYQLNKVPKPQRRTCHICGMIFFKQSLYLNHRIDVHNDYPKKCLECGKPMKKNKKLRKHMRKCHPTKLISCDVCSDGFLTNKDLKKHYKLHQGTSTRGWYVSTFEHSASSSVESKGSIKSEECTDITMGTEKSKDNLCLPIIKAEPI